MNARHTQAIQTIFARVESNGLVFLLFSAWARFICTPTSCHYLRRSAFEIKNQRRFQTKTGFVVTPRSFLKHSNSKTRGKISHEQTTRWNVREIAFLPSAKRIRWIGKLIFMLYFYPGKIRNARDIQKKNPKEQLDEEEDEETNDDGWNKRT